MCACSVYFIQPICFSLTPTLIFDFFFLNLNSPAITCSLSLYLSALCPFRITLWIVVAGCLESWNVAARQTLIASCNFTPEHFAVAVVHPPTRDFNIIYCWICLGSKSFVYFWTYFTIPNSSLFTQIVFVLTLPDIGPRFFFAVLPHGFSQVFAVFLGIIYPIPKWLIFKLLRVVGMLILLRNFGPISYRWLVVIERDFIACFTKISGLNVNRLAPSLTS